MDIGEIVRSVTLTSAMGLAAIAGTGCATNGSNPNLSSNTPVNMAALKADEKEFLNKYVSMGRPYLFENAEKLEKEYAQRGWDTKHLTDAQALKVYRDFGDYMRFLQTSSIPK